jgi:hypothetical protein
MFWAAQILHYLGATVVRIADGVRDPETEQEFLAIEYESNTRYTWEQYQAAKSTVLQTRGGKLIRAYRDKLLRETDWIMTTDNVATIENIQEWVSYRQALRDLPETLTEYIWIQNDLDYSRLNILQKPTIQRKKTA